MSPTRRLVFVLTGVTCAALAVPFDSSADTAMDCAGAARFLEQTLGQANHCAVAADCTYYPYDRDMSAGCDRLFNKAEIAAVDRAVALYAEHCGPHWHCRGRADQDIACVDRVCRWAETPASLDRLLPDQ